jgi:PIF1-like helicase/UvrD-like helicase C-terminal domain
MDAKKVILTPKNDCVHKLNDDVLMRLEGEENIYLSIDRIKSDDDGVHIQFQMELLNSVTPSGLPLHQLKLKVGSTIMLLRNLSLTKGLCNGTRLIVMQLKPNTIVATIASGSKTGNMVIIPRISLDTTKDPSLPFVLERHQFPVRLAYAMTINKAQGQTFETVGIFLPDVCFGHGELYVAFSRSRSFSNIKFQNFGNNNKTKNVVYTEIL